MKCLLFLIPVALCAPPARAQNLIATDRPLVQRVLLQDTPSRAIAVGMPSQFNYVIDSVTLTPLYVWYGGFLNLKAELSGRGGRPCSIIGDRINLGLPTSPLRFADANNSRPDVRFQGYRREGRKPPVFLGRIDGHQISQTIRLAGSRRIAVEYEFRSPREVDAFFHLGTFDPKQITTQPDLRWVAEQPALLIPRALTRFTIQLDLSGLKGVTEAAGAFTGHSLYTQYCSACHSFDGSKLIGPSFQEVWGSTRSVVTAGTTRDIVADPDYLRRSILDPQADIVVGFETVPMPPFKDLLSDQEIDLLVSFVQEVSQLRRQAKTVAHKALGLQGTLEIQASPKYPGKGVATLTDGVVGSIDFRDGKWLGFEGADIAFTLDLGKETQINTLQADFLQDTRVGIHVPKQVEFALSNDGKAFHTVALVESELVLPAATRQTSTISTEAIGEAARFLRVRVANGGRKHWLFISEVLVRD